jgi:glutamate synthase (ferredoxin)
MTPSSVAILRRGVESPTPCNLQMDIQRPPIPTLLAVGAVHHHLIRTGLRTETSIVADTSQCFSTHQVCTLVGYGAHAVCPYLALETARQWRASPR